MVDDGIEELSSSSQVKILLADISRNVHFVTFYLWQFRMHLKCRRFHFATRISDLLSTKVLHTYLGNHNNWYRIMMWVTIVTRTGPSDALVCGPHIHMHGLVCNRRRMQNVCMVERRRDVIGRHTTPYLHPLTFSDE